MCSEQSTKPDVTEIFLRPMSVYYNIFEMISDCLRLEKDIYI